MNTRREDTNPTHEQASASEVIIPIRGVVQRYSWGKPGRSSRVGVLSKEAENAPQEPFAELWFGAHRSHPSPLVSPHGSATTHHLATNLLEYLSVREESCTAQSKQPVGLPFLLKVLSVGAPLSIQLHPTKHQAEKLHKDDPSHYPDSNHKPELAVALTEVELVCGVSSPEKIIAILTAIPELASLLGHEVTTAPRDTLVRRLFSELFTRSKDELEKLVAITLHRAASIPFLAHNLRWALIAKEQSSLADPGLLVLLLLEHIALQPGEAVYIAPGVPHAYLSGDLVECMASSDNVVRAGLTPKFIDITAFLELLQCDAQLTHRLSPVSDGTTAAKYFTPPVKDFALIRCTHTSGYLRAHTTGPAIVFCNEGEITITCPSSQLTYVVSSGEAVFVPHVTPTLRYAADSADMFIACSSHQEAA